MIYDGPTNIKLGTVLPELAAKWTKVREDFWNAHKLQLKVIEGLRTFGQQWDTYSQGRLKEKTGEWIICDIKKVVTYSMPGKSYHQYGLAIDSGMVGDDPYLSKVPHDECNALWISYGKICNTNGLTWGGDFKKFPDRPHCEMTCGLSVHELQIIYEDLGLRGVWEKCKNNNLCGSEIK